jgi:acetoin utilization deacetylase AcuC-like enzyme
VTPKAPHSTPRVGYLGSSVFLEHVTDLFSRSDDSHPETPQRLVAIQQAMDASGLFSKLTRLEPVPATRSQLSLVHEPTMIDRVEALAAAGGGLLDEDTVVSPGSLNAALLAAGGGILAVDRVLAGELDRVFLAVRPPGHHATASRSMGFCLFNNVAVATAHALSDRRLKRVAIVDWDLHHGNGTQDIFYSRGDVFYVSLHQHPLYPGTGLARESGEGEGHGATLNIPLPAGSGDAVFVEKLKRQVIPALRRFGPELVMLSAGFDAHDGDPLGGLEVSTAGFRQFTDLMVEFANEACQGRIISFLEGGYNLGALAESVVAHVEGLLTAAPSTR